MSGKFVSISIIICDCYQSRAGGNIEYAPEEWKDLIAPTMAGVDLRLAYD